MKAVAEGLQLHKRYGRSQGIRSVSISCKRKKPCRAPVAMEKINCSLHVVSGLTYIKVILIVNLFLFLKEPVGSLLQ